MAPTDDNKTAFDSLPSGSPPPGLDTRIRAAAREQVAPKSKRAPYLIASLATVVLAVLVARPLWFGAPVPVSTKAEPSAADSLPTAQSADLSFSRERSSVAAVADTRGQTFSAERSLTSAPTAELARAPVDVAEAEALPSPAAALPEITAKRAGAEDTAIADDMATLSQLAAQGVRPTAVDAQTWWAQIETLFEHGHIDKARIEYNRLREAHPSFEMPEKTSDDIRNALTEEAQN